VIVLGDALMLTVGMGVLLLLEFPWPAPPPHPISHTITQIIGHGVQRFMRLFRLGQLYRDYLFQNIDSSRSLPEGAPGRS